jgi:transcriptional regulator with XRE-family HTH domain
VGRVSEGDRRLQAIPAQSDDDGWSSERGLAALIDDFMTSRALTLQQMAHRTGMSIATIAALRAGTRGKRPHRATLEKLARVMELDVATLVGAVAAGGGPARIREAQLVERFRGLDDADKTTVELLVARLAAPVSNPTTRQK